jgi:AcrR family transcriptional regulator
MPEGGITQARGRPRQFTDEVVFAAIHHIITAEGYERLTLARLAAVIGHSGPAVVKRFTSRQGLLVAYLRWGTTQTQQHLATLPADRSAVDRLMGFLLPTAGTEAIAPEAVRLPHLAGLVLEAQTDPLLRTALQQHVAVVAAGTQRLLDDAIMAGELAPVDTGQLARRLLETVSGAALLVELEVRGSGEAPARALREVVLDVLAPHRPEPPEHSPG